MCRVICCPISFSLSFAMSALRGVLIEVAVQLMQRPAPIAVAVRFPVPGTVR